MLSKFGLKTTLWVIIFQHNRRIVALKFHDDVLLIKCFSAAATLGDNSTFPDSLIEDLNKYKTKFSARAFQPWYIFNKLLSGSMLRLKYPFKVFQR